MKGTILSVQGEIKKKDKSTFRGMDMDQRAGISVISLNLRDFSAIM